ncbi:MAG: fibronectin type III domain-containing protein [Deltaproteobacteria bacterium]|nr:fibronectin type III domain-containing protein [Deltaproteobacteria bacterium]
MHALSYIFFKLFKYRIHSLFSLVFLNLFVLFALLLSPNIAHCFNLSFAWDANTEPDLDGYRVFYREEGQNYDFDFPDWEGTESTCTIYGLYDNTTYYFVARAYDIYGNESENSIELFTSDAGATISTTSDGGGGGGCFIATAAFGSIIEPHVKLLRQFRDRFLLPNTPGKTFVRLYYAYSPPIADFISAHESLRMIVRWSLFPLIGFSWMLLHLGLASTLFLIVLTGSVMWVCYGKIRPADRQTS